MNRIREPGVTDAVSRLEAALADSWTQTQSLGRARYVVWRDGGPGAGWGNRFRGMTSSLLLSLVTKRRFLIDHKEFFRVFSDPSTIAGTLNYQAMVGELQTLTEKLLPYTSPAYRHPISLSQKQTWSHKRVLRDDGKWRASSRHILNSDADVLVHQCGCSFELAILGSPDDSARRRVQGIFGSLREDVLVEVAMRFLTRQPLQSLVDNAHKVLESWQHRAYDGFAMVQDRQWTDVKGKNRGAKEKGTDRPHLNCTYKRLEAYRSTLPGKKRLLIGVTSDSTAYADTMIRAFSSLGDVRRNDMFMDNAMSYKATSTPLVARQFIVDWYLLGEAPFVVCTGSTYCVSARASKGIGNDGSFPFISDRRTYRQGGPFCYGLPGDQDNQLSIDTLSHPLDGRIFW